ncbi:MAG TPA: helix-turn-helix transcriptional regulator [Acetobacteraceae bacterium]|jgi:DNA-binding CsgD family transcriptional regulator|nr:helix-turn-helix transcriptional regulator [Acetobacteraceae bacterium]
MDLASFSDLIAAFYEAGCDPLQWAALAQRVAKAFGAESGSLQVQNLLPNGTTSFLGITANVTAQARAEYEQHYFQRDVYVHHAIEHGLTGAYLSQHAVAPAEVARTEFYTDWGRRTGIFHVVGGGAMLGPSQVALLAVHRPMRAPGFTEQDRAQLALLLPHAGRALQLAAQLGGLRAQQDARTAALDQLQVGAVFLAADATILWHNAVAEHLFREGDALCAVAGRLAARRRQDELLCLLRNCATPSAALPPPGGLLSMPRPGRIPLSLLVGPLAEGTVPAGPARPVAAVFIHDPERVAAPDRAALARLYHLTAAEARLATALAAGERLQAYAERHRLSLATVKTQLREVLAKTGTTRQAELAATLAHNSILRLATPFA